ncbi:MAG: hypothetical protein IMF17_07295 [Proteobacteria bacterium]|nr:hypothetical protein [Pseudomonadota bacterium]
MKGITISPMDILILPLTLMGLVFITAPFTALIPTVIFGWLYLKSKQKSNVAAALLWGFYTIYEHMMYLRILCSGECNIRIDLLLIYPLLLIASIIAISATIRHLKKN